MGARGKGLPMKSEIYLLPEHYAAGWGTSPFRTHAEINAWGSVMRKPMTRRLCWNSAKPFTDT